METEFRRVHCAKCGKERWTSKCAGCSQDFCYNHLPDHRQELSQQLDEIEINRNLLRQTLNEQTNNPEQHLLIKQIDEWEKDSIKIIEETAKQCRESLFEHTTKSINQIETNLSKLTDEMREIRKENDFNEIDLNQLKNKLTKLAEELDKPANVSVQQESTSLIKKIRIVVSSRKFVFIIFKLIRESRFLEKDEFFLKI
jgi:chromosome segregation ATPase